MFVVLKQRWSSSGVCDLKVQCQGYDRISIIMVIGTLSAAFRLPFLY